MYTCVIDESVAGALKLEFRQTRAVRRQTDDNDSNHDETEFKPCKNHDFINQIFEIWKLNFKQSSSYPATITQQNKLSKSVLIHIFILS